jgi:subtilisin family serine protease
MGTSMSTPIVSGNAALVRQYLTDGWYPSGVKNSADSFTRVASSLLKAILIHSTVPVTGSVQLDDTGNTINLNDKPFPTLYR